MTHALYAKQQYPQGQSHLAIGLNNMGGLLQAQGAYEQARDYYERALAIYQVRYPKERFPQGHADLASSLSRIGALLDLQGADGKARGYYEQALAMNEALYPKERYPQGHPDVASSLNNLGQLLEDQGDYAKARAYLERALAIRQSLYPKKRYPRGHRELATSLSNLGGWLYAQGRYGEAMPLVQQGADMQQGLADVLVAATSEAEALNYLAQLPLDRDAVISVCLHVPDSDEASYARVWDGKAAVARMLRRRRAELSRQAAADPAIRRVVNTWRDVRSQLARMLMATADGRDHPERLTRLQQLTTEKDRIERRLAEAIPDFLRRQALEVGPHNKLVEMLADHTVVLDLVKYIRIERAPPIDGDKGWSLTQSYIGYVLAKGRPVRGGSGPGHTDRRGG